MGAVAPLAACQDNAGVITFNTQEASSDAAAAAYAVNVIESIPAVSANVPKVQEAQFNAAIADLKAITATIAANTNGTISVDVGRTWMKQLGTDLNTVLQIAGPIVGTFAPGAAGYISVAQQLVPLINILVGNVSVIGPDGAVGRMSAPMVRARIYQGV